MKFCTEHGEVIVAPDVFSTLAGHAATRCFGVKGMAARSVGDGIVGLLRREHIARGVKVTFQPEKGMIGVALHIVVDHGVNIPVITRSIMSEVRYVLEKCTGVKVGKMSVFVDAIMAEPQKTQAPKKGGAKTLDK